MFFYILPFFIFISICVMRKIILSILLLVVALQGVAQQEREYPFLIADTPARLYTMRQSNENFLSAYRLGTRALYNFLPDTMKLGSKKITSTSVAMGIATLCELVLSPLTHEEGHRSVLTAEGIGSISEPFYDWRGAAYVNGVRDVELQRLRDTKFPTYMRLHIAGNESDYALAIRENSLVTWEQETPIALYPEYVFRKLSPMLYYLIPIDIEESSNELERDIVGNDVLSAIRHLHRPDMEFKRYTNFDDLTDEEKKFQKRVAYRSLFNLADPLLLFLKSGFTLKSGLKFNFSGGYGMAPFGDFIDQQFWLKTQRLNINFYLREYENRSTWFPAAGVKFANIPIAKWMQADVSLHGWQQPKGLDFNATQGRWGGAVDVMLRQKFFSTKTQKMAVSLNLGIVAKTQGYLLEEMALGSHVGLCVGASIWLK
jgi:hypothetical protein